MARRAARRNSSSRRRELRRIAADHPQAYVHPTRTHGGTPSGLGQDRLLGPSASAIPSLQARFAGIHSAYETRSVTLLQRAKTQALVPAALPTDQAATLFLCMIQGLGFQFAIARRPMRLRRKADQIFALYLRAITNPLSLRRPSNGQRRRQRRQRKNNK